MNHDVAYIIAALAEETGGKLKKHHTLQLAEAYIELHAMKLERNNTDKLKKPIGTVRP